MPPQFLTSFEIQKSFQVHFEVNSVYSKNNLPQLNDEACIMNLDEYKSIVMHWVALYVNSYNVTYFDGFGIEYILKET